jgi:WD40 repeat protein
MAERDDDLRLRIARQDLPWPLEPLIYRALRAESADHQHERLTMAWEAICRVAGGTLAAVCRRLGLKSPELAQATATLVRPSFGHWIALIRAGRALLEGRREAEARALAPLLEGLASPFAKVPALAALAEAVRRTPGKSIAIDGKTAFDLLGAMPAYRNAMQSTHADAESGVRERNAPIVLEGLLAMLELAPPVGELSLVVPSKLWRDGEDWKVELATMQGGGPVPATRSLARDVWEALVRGRVYLHTPPSSFVPLLPFAAAELGADGWNVGWLEGRVRDPQFQYGGGAQGGFRAAVPPDDVRDVFAVRSADDAAEVLDASLLAIEPWRGLLAYEEAHAGLFFGREEEVESALARLRKDACVVVCGASGSGKSSLAAAGVLPRLRDALEAEGAKLAVVRLTPGKHPLAALRGALLGLDVGGPTESIAWSQKVEELLGDDLAKLDPGALAHLARGLAAAGMRLLVFVDQLEEAVTMCADAAERGRFLDVVAGLGKRAAGARAGLLVTVRADLVGELFSHPEACALVEAHFFPLGTMSPERLVRVVTEPLRGRRVSTEPGLAETIVQDVGEEPGALALLSQVLATLWDERGKYGDRLTKQGYDAAGRVAGALQTQAEHALVEAIGTPADASKRALVERVLLQLAHVSEEGTFVRRRVAFGELEASTGATAAALRAVVEPFVARRLFVTGNLDAPEGAEAPAEARADRTLEVAHEALLSAWRHAADLLRSQTEILLLRQEVVADARGWQRAARTGELWTDASTKLRRAEELLEGGRLDLGPNEREFLRSSRRAVGRRRQLERAFLVFVALLATVAIVLWRAAERSRREARTAQESAERSRNEEHAAREAAERATLGEQAVRTASLAHKEGYEHAALALALQSAAPFVKAGKPLPPPVAEALVGAVTLAATVPQRGHSKSAHVGDFDRQGTLVVTGGRDRAVRVWDARDGRLYATLLGHAGTITGAGFSPDAKRVMSASVDGTIRIWPTLGEGPVLKIDAFAETSVSIAEWSPDGTKVLAGSGKGGVGVWDARTGARLLSFVHDKKVWSVTWSRDGARLATASEDGTARVWSASDGKLLRELAHPDEVDVARFSSDGKRLLTECADQAARIWTIDDPAAPPIVIANKDARLEDVGWSPDDAIVALADDDGVLRTFDAKSGAALHAWHEHKATIFGLVFSPDGTRIATASKDRTVRIVRADGTGVPQALFGHAEKVIGVAFAPSGDRLLSFGFDPVPRLWNVETGALMSVLSGVPAHPSAALRARLGQPLSPSAGPLVTLLGHTGGINGIAFSPDGTRLVTASSDLSARTWDAKTGAPIARHEIGKLVNGAAWSPDGTRVVLAADDPAVQVWSPDDDRVVKLVGHHLAVYAVAWAAAGDRIVSCGEDGEILVWDAKSASLARKLGERAEKACRATAFSIDGKRVAVGSIDGNLRVFDVETGALAWSVQAHRTWINGVAFSPTDSRRLATSGIDQFVRLWTLGEPKPFLETDAHNDWVHAVAFSVDGERLLTSGSDRTARVWDARDLSPMSTYEVPARATAASFSPKHDAVAIGVEDGVGRVYPTDPGAYFSIGCALLRGLPEAAKVAAVCGGR